MGIGSLLDAVYPAGRLLSVFFWICRYYRYISSWGIWVNFKNKGAKQGVKYI